MADFDPLHPVFHDPELETFTVGDHLEDRDIKALLEFAKHGTIGEPENESDD